MRTPWVHLLLQFAFLTICHGQSAKNATNAIDACTKEGEEHKFLNGFFVCHNKRYVPVACTADDGSRVDIGMTVRQGLFVQECAQASLNGSSLTWKPIACLKQKNASAKKSDFTQVQPGQKIADGPYVYECHPYASDKLRLQAVACTNGTSKNGEEIADGGVVRSGDFTFYCRVHSDPNGVKSVSLEAKGCIYQNREYARDQEVLVDNFWYRCQTSSSGNFLTRGIEFAPVACAENGQRYKENEKFYSGNIGSRYVLQCRKIPRSLSAEPIGCIQEAKPPVEHLINETWVEEGGRGDQRLKYLVQCTETDTSLFQQTIKCVYQPKPGPANASSVSTIDPGCMKKFGAVLIKCFKKADGSTAIELVRGKREEQMALAAGLKYC